MYAQYRCIKAEQCLRLPEDATPAEGASCFVNPLTALGMVETMRREGHSALVHTAAASNLGQMLNRICLQDKVALVNIVRNFGFSWGMGGWLLFPFLGKIGPAAGHAHLFLSS